MILDIDEVGVTVKFQWQTLNVARFRAGEEGEGKDVGDAELGPSQARFRQIGEDLGSQLRQVDVEKDMWVDGEDGTLPQGAGATFSGERFRASTRNDSGAI